MIIWTYDWVPRGPRGNVRDIRLRWALEEAGLAYEVRTVSFDVRGAEHLARQPFAQAPFIEDAGVTIFESGACLLYIGKQSETLMPRDRRGEADVTQWLIAALNSVEMVTVPWWFIGLGGAPANPLAGWMNQRFERLEPVLAGREWLAAGQFSIADILMSDALRMPLKLGALADFPALRAYVDRACARPAFTKAYDDQMAHFAAGDATRAGN